MHVSYSCKPEEGINRRLGACRRCVHICVHGQHGIRQQAATYCGAMPNKRADIRTDMTPKKKETFSRVRTTLADCQEAESLVIRLES